MINGFEDVQKAGREGMNRALESFGALSTRLADAGERDGRLFQAVLRGGRGARREAARREVDRRRLRGADGLPPRLLREGGRPGGALRRALSRPRQGSDEALRGLCPDRQEVSFPRFSRVCVAPGPWTGRFCFCATPPGARYRARHAARTSAEFPLGCGIRNPDNAAGRPKLARLGDVRSGDWHGQGLKQGR